MPPKQSARAASSSAAAATVSAPSPMVAPPMWVTYSVTAWKKFRNEFRDYQAKGGQRPIRVLLSATVSNMLEIQFEAFEKQPLDLSVVTDAQFITSINEAMAPADKGKALEQLQKLRMEECSHDSFMTFVSEFSLEVKNFPAELKPEPEMLVKCFISKLQPTKLRNAVARQGFKDFKKALLFTVNQEDKLNSHDLMVSSPQEGKRAKNQGQKIATSGASNSDFSGKRDPLDRISSSSGKKHKCFNCNEKGHIAKDCTKPMRIRTHVPDVKLG